MHAAEKDGVEVLVCTVGKTILLYDYRCLADLQAMLKSTRTGWNSVVPMSKSQQSQVLSELGAVQWKTP